MNMVLAAAQESDGSLILLGLAALVVLGYVLSLFLHPLTRCGRCKGTPRNYGSIYGKSFRNCGKCNGAGREKRLGARMLGIGP